MIDWIIEFLEKKKKKSAIRQNYKRKKKIKKLMIKLYRESAIFKVSVEDLDYMKNIDSKNNIEYRWFVEYTEEFLN